MRKSDALSYPPAFRLPPLVQKMPASLPAAVWRFLHCLFAAGILLAAADSRAGTADPESLGDKLRDAQLQIFVENGKMRFRINPRSAKRARLQLSSRLLALAELVDEEPRSPAFVGPSSQAR